MRGSLFFVATAAFMVGIAYGTIATPCWQNIAGSFLGACGCFLLGSVMARRLVVRAQLFVFSAALILLMFPLGELRTELAPRALPSVYDSLINVPISFTGTIITDPDIRAKNQQLIVTVHRKGIPTNILVFAPLFQHFAYGEKILIAGTLTKPAPFTTEDGRVFRYDQYLAKKGVFSVVPQADILEVAPPSGMLSTMANFLFTVKHTFIEGLSRALPDPYAELATGLLTGDQHGLSNSLVTELSLSGLIWIVVLSGYHVTLIAEAVLKVFRFLPQKTAFAAAGLSILSIVFATGASAPSLRGGIMACFTLFARATGRTYDALRALCAAAILILVWNPLLLSYDSGFQLSLVVTPALIFGVPILEARLLWIKSAFAREVVAVSTVAQLACLPLILWQTGQVGMWAIPANMLVMSLVPISIFFAMGAGFTGIFIPLLAPLAGLPAYMVLYYLAAVAKIAAALPFADAYIPEFPLPMAAGMYALFILAAYWLWRTNRPKSVITIRPRSRNAFQ